MVLLPSFAQWLSPFAQAMTAPTFQHFSQLVAGWLLASRRTVTGALKLTRLSEHFCSYHRVLSQAAWELDVIGLALLSRLRAWAGPVITLAIDDTLCHHRGRRMWGVGSHYDPQLTSSQLSHASRRGASTTLKRRGQAWVVLAVVLTFPFFPHHAFALPVLFRLYLNRKTAAQCGRRYRTRTELAVELLELVTTRFPQGTFHLLVDSAYAGQHLLGRLPRNCQLTARWIAHPALYGPVPDPVPGQKGRPRQHGPRLEKVETRLEQRCSHVTLDVYGKHTTYRLASLWACFYATPRQLVQVVAAEPLTQGGTPLPQHRAVFYSTDLALAPEEVIAVYAQRWSLEVTFHDTKGHLGLEDPQGTCRATVERHTPVLFLLYSLIVLWFAHTGHRRWQRPRWPWYPQKATPSFADMLACLRQTTLRYQFRALFQNPLCVPLLQKTLHRLLTLWKRAA
jgi:hypothetical protein